MKNKIIAVDFDGTLCENKYPEIGEPRKDVIQKLIKEQQAGARVILWTCRRGAYLLAAIYWALDHGVEFDAVNENLPETVEYFGEDTRKVCADEYWDDRAVIPFEKEAASEKIISFEEIAASLKYRIDTLCDISKGANFAERIHNAEAAARMLFLSELNEQAEKVCKELIAAKRAAKTEKGVKAAYHKGRAEELDKWLASLENMITKVMTATRPIC